MKIKRILALFIISCVIVGNLGISYAMPVDSPKVSCSNHDHEHAQVQAISGGGVTPQNIICDVFGHDWGSTAETYRYLEPNPGKCMRLVIGYRRICQRCNFVDIWEEIYVLTHSWERHTDPNGFEYDECIWCGLIRYYVKAPLEP